MDQVIIHGSCEVKEDQKSAVAAAAVGFLADVRKEDGLIAYDLSWDVLEPNCFLLVEHWVSEDAYALHTQQPHVGEWGAMMKLAARTPLQVIKSRATAL